MDSSHFSNISLISKSTADSAVANHELYKSRNDSTISTAKPVSFFDSYFCQSFSLPNSLMFYLVKNPSTTKCYEKIIQTCKYFFIKNPIFVVSDFVLEYNNDEWQTRFNGKPIELKSEKNKIWASHVINIHNKNFEGEEILVFPVLPKFYQSDISELSLLDIYISFNDLIPFTSKCKKVKFDCVIVMDTDDTVVALETIIEIFPYLEQFHFHHPENGNVGIITSKTMEELLKIPHFGNLTYFGLFYIPESLNIDLFYNYMKKNKKTQLALEFSDGEEISEAYTNQLQAIVNEVLADKSRDYRAPHLYYPGNDFEICYKLWRLSEGHTGAEGVPSF